MWEAVNERSEFPPQADKSCRRQTSLEFISLWLMREFITALNYGDLSPSCLLEKIFQSQSGNELPHSKD